MSTQSFSTRIRHDSDATWQEWRDEFAATLGALTSLAADETNITPGAGARPGTSTEGGYAVFHLADALHGTAPIYLRFGFGTGSGATTPRVQVGVGTATNGSGVLSGTGSGAGNVAPHASTAQTADTPRQSYFCANEGFLGFDWKIGTSITEAGFFICRTCDANGAPTATGALAHWGNGTIGGFTRRQAFRYAAAAVEFTQTTAIDTGHLGMNPQARISTVVGADNQAMLGYTVTPRVEPLFGVCGVLPAEVTPGSTFSVALVGNTARTYLAWTANAGIFGPLASIAGTIHTAMLWE